MPAHKILASVSRDARLTFVYLITQADDDGYVAGELRSLLGTLFVHDRDVTEDVLAGWLNELEAIGVIARHDAPDYGAVVQVVNWHKHQRIDRPTPSRLLPPQPGGTPEALARLSRAMREDVAKVQRPDHGPWTMDHGPWTSTPAAPVDADFAEAWTLYPKRGGGNSRTKAVKAWRARMQQKVEAVTLVAGVGRYAAHIRAIGKENTPYVMQAATFFGPDRHWEEPWDLPPPEAPRRGAAKPPPDPQLDQYRSAFD